MNAPASPFSLRARLLPLALAVFSVGCACAPTTGKDGGEQPDAGFDAGQPPVPDAGFDAGEPDAGPPPQLKLLKVLPPRGSTGGGTPVTLQGEGFIRGFSTRGTEAKTRTTLRFGSNPVIDYQIIDDNTLELRSPPGSVGPAAVAMTNPNGQVLCAGCYIYYDEIVLSSVTPAEGPLAGGNEVTLAGKGFTSDLEVLVGNLSSPKITFVSATQVKAVVPRGAVADLVDITVYSKNGVGNLRRAYRYVDSLALTSLSPPTGPIAGGTVVTFTGKGFSGATQVRFGATAGTALNVASDTSLTVTSPAAAAGAVDLTVVTPRETRTFNRAFTYFDPAGSFAVLGVFPHVAIPGQTVTVTGQGLDAAGLTLTIGGNVASVGAQTFSTAVVTVPPRAAAPRVSDVAGNNGVSTQTLSGGFTWRLSVGAINPTQGPQAGGAAASLNGNALPADARVWLGALEATSVVVSGEASATLVTPRGAGGAPSDVVVREGADSDNEAVLPAAYEFLEDLAIGRVQPDRGGIAGNTLVTVLGAGFGDSTTVTFGQYKAKDVKVIDAHTVTCRTPKADAVGTVDVRVDRLTQNDSLAGGFSYFDPRSISGGVSGGPLVGTLNVTVLDATQGFYGAPVPQTTVMLGIDGATPFQGLTDSRGQITFSDPSLVKAQVVTAFKEFYESVTVTGVASENLTVFITRTGGGDGSPGLPPPGPPASVISGKVTGFKSPRALGTTEVLEARVFVAQSSLYGGPPFAGLPNKKAEKWRITTEGGEYLVYTGAGLHATYAVMGILEKQTQTFTPYLMGVRRGVTTSADQPATDQNIILDMHLDLTVPITIDSPLTEPGSFGLPDAMENAVYAWLDLGAEGFIPNPNNWGTGTNTKTSVLSNNPTNSFPNFPPLDGSNFIFLNNSNSAMGYPVSYYFRRQPGPMNTGVTIGPMLPTPRLIKPIGTFDGTISWTVDPGPTPDIHNVQILKPTLFGYISLWSMVLPGSERQVVLPQPAVDKLRAEEAGPLLAVVYSSRSPKFSYQQWTYDTLSGVSWSSFTVALSSDFTP